MPIKFLTFSTTLFIILTIFCQEAMKLENNKYIKNYLITYKSLKRCAVTLIVTN
jgi:hypothetical protein